jgi:hypothetical protein
MARSRPIRHEAPDGGTFYTAVDGSWLLGWSRERLIRAITTGALAGHRADGRWWVDAEACDRLAQRATVVP